MTNRINFDAVRLQIEAMIRDNDLTDDEVLRADMLEGATDLHGALTSLANHAAETAEMVEALGGTLSNIKARRVRFEARIAVLRELMLQLMQAADLKKIELPAATLSQVRQQPQLVGDLDADRLSDDLVRIKREVNRTAVRAALDAGRVIEGVWLGNAAPTLMMKVK